MNESSSNWQKITELFERCAGHPEENLDEIIRVSGERDEKIISEVKKMVRNQKKASGFFSSLKKRINKELSDNSSQPLFSPGVKIDKFIIIRPLKVGKNTDIYLVEDGSGFFSRLSVIKLFRSACRQSLKKQRTEYRILSMLSHRYIVDYLNKGTTNNGNPWIAMEYIEGSLLNEYCDKQELNLHSRLKLIIQVCDAIGYIHSKSIIHNDIKPSNILVTRQGEVKLIDFGISVFTYRNYYHSFRKGFFHGTIRYASPEQIQGAHTSYSSDIYQVGLLIHKIIAGSLPAFTGKSSGQNINNEQDPRFFAGLLKTRYKIDASPSASARLFYITGKATASNPEDRYSSAQEIKNDLLKVF